jgi:hypothetical protein
LGSCFLLHGPIDVLFFGADRNLLKNATPAIYPLQRNHGWGWRRLYVSRSCSKPFRVIA